MDEDNECTKCHKSFKTKYTLKTHSKKCNEQIKQQTIFSCDGCKNSFDRKFNLNRHQTRCLEYKKIEEKITIEKNHIEENKELKQRIIDYEKHIDIEKSKIQEKDKQIEMLRNIIESTLKESINKPTFTNNTNTHNSFRDCLSKDNTLDQLSDKQIIERFKLNMTEQIFFGGQRQIARLCYDAIIKLKDGKLIVCCTDISRGKFKMYDLHGNIKEDIEARYFTDKVSKYIKVAAKDIYDCVVESIEDEQSMLTEIDSYKKQNLMDKYKRTCDAYIEIINVDDPDRNIDFRNELASLTSVNIITK